MLYFFFVSRYVLILFFISVVEPEVKASAWNVGDPGSIPGSGRSPAEGKWQPTPVLLPGESHAERSLVGYSAWGCKESDRTEWVHFHFHFHFIVFFSSDIALSSVTSLYFL